MTALLEALMVAALAGSLPADEPTSKPFVPELHELSSQLCVERFENSGAMNAHPGILNIYSDRVRESPDYKFVLSGGQAACVSIFPGRYVVIVTSSRTYGSSSAKSDECHSLPYKTSLKAGERVILNVWPAISKDGYSDCGWDVLPRGTSQPGKCTQPRRSPECSKAKSPGTRQSGLHQAQE